MNANQLAQEIIESTKRSTWHGASIEKLPAEDAVVLVPYFAKAFEEHRLWPKDAATIIAACRPTDDQLLELLQDGHERFQKLGLHVLALRMETEEFQGRAHCALAEEVLRLLQSDTIRPRRKDLRPLLAWAASHIDPSDKQHKL